MQWPDKVLDSSSLAFLLASQREDGRFQVEWASRALLAMIDASDATTYAQTVFDALDRSAPHGSRTVFAVPRIDANRTRHEDRVSGRFFDAAGTRYWVGSVTDGDATAATAEERDQVLERIAAGAAAVLGILQVTEAMRKEVTLPSAVAVVPALLVPAWAQWASVQVLGPDSDTWSAVSSAHEDGHLPADFQRYVGSLLPGQLRQSMHNAVLAGRQPFALIAPVTENDLEMAVPRGAAKVLGAMSIGSALTVPLLAGDAIIGTILLVRGKGRAGFSVQDVEMARLLGQRVGNVLRGIERAEARRQKAIHVQNALLPDIPAVPGVEAISVYRPSASYASVGGDWFDVVALGNAAVGLSIGDVCGHDMGSMGAMAAYRWTIRTYLWQGHDPGTALDLLDRQLGRLPEFPQLATAVVARVERTDAHRFRLSYTAAGHLPPIVLAPNGRLALLDDASATPIGIAPATLPRPVRSVELLYGSTLVLFTDGVVERRGVPLWERIDALHAALRSIGGQASIEEVRDVLLQQSDGHPLEDDMSFVVARIWPSLGSARSQSMRAEVSA